MTESVSSESRKGRAGTRRVAVAAGLLVPAVAFIVAIVAAARGSAPPTPSASPRLADVLSQTIQSKGIEAGLAQYRHLRKQGFPQLAESEPDTNALGYRLLRKGQVGAAIQVFQLNVETHPMSANVHDSLAEAYVAAGNKELAIESYRNVLALDDTAGTAAGAIRRLTGAPLSPLAMLHIGGGTLGIASGFVAIFLRKGSRRHRVVGNVFVVSMLTMSADAAYLALRKSQSINVLMGVLTFYLVATAWSAGKRRNGETGVFDQVALLAALALVAAFVTVGWEAAQHGGNPEIYVFFGALVLLAAAGDARMLLRGGVFGAHRIARHLWRMCFALFIATGSLFLGQPQVFPAALRTTGVLFVPVVLVIALLSFWLVRVLFTKAYKGAASPRPTMVIGPAAT